MTPDAYSFKGTPPTPVSPDTDMQDSPSPVRTVQLPEATPGAGSGKPLVNDRMDLLRNVKARVKVVAGHTQTTVAALLNLQQGAVLTLDEAVGTPFDLELEGDVIARGVLVAVGDRFGLRISEIAPRAAQGKS